MDSVLTAVVVLIVSSFGWSQVKGQQVYLKLEKGQLTTIYNKPGVTWKSCKKNKAGGCSEAIGWVDRDTKVWIAGEKVEAPTYDPFKDETVKEDFYPVQFEYSRTTKGGTVNKKRGDIGYIDAAYIETKRVEPIYPAKKPDATPASTDKKPCLPTPDKPEADFATVAWATHLRSIEETANLLKDKIGFCADLKSDRNTKANLYDSVILPQLQNMAIPKISGEGGKRISKAQLVDVDALARTLYGEMASCFKHGLEYPMAVARIAVNRTESTDYHSAFIQGPHSDKKSNLSRVVTSPNQFSLWLRKLNGKKNPPLGMAMCPPRDSKQKLWHGNKPSPVELQVWNQAVQIATEAVLFPSTFKSRTKKLDQRYFYTSGVGKFYRMQKVSAQIEGRSLNKSKCIEIWHDKKMDRKTELVTSR